MDEVSFIAQVGNWVVIKKQKVEPGTKKMEVARILASIRSTMDKKIWDFMRDDIDLAKLDTLAQEIVGDKGKVSEERMAGILAKLNSPGTGKRIGELAQTKNGKEIAKMYLTNRVLELANLRIHADADVIQKYIDEKEKGAVG